MSEQRLNPIRVILIVCVAAAIIIPAYMIGYRLVNHIDLNMHHLIYGIVFSFAISASISSVNFYTVSVLEIRYPWNRSKTKRLLYEFLITNFNASVIITIVVIILDRLFYRWSDEHQKLFSYIYNNITIALIVNTIVVAIYEGQAVIRKWLHSLLEVEQLRREKAESQYAVLKNQVNPHFLFNSLNSLNSLIRLSPEKAIEFVDNFSKIYRYVLDVGDKMVVELHDELDFLQSYYFLQKIRFGNNLEIDVKVDATRLNDFLLPLSIQMLIENAIKHNEISSERPLRISINTEDEYLVISNNLQLKTVFEDSTGIGIINITERYKHFTEKEPQFYANATSYFAKIPLLKENE